MRRCRMLTLRRAASLVVLFSPVLVQSEGAAETNLKDIPLGRFGEPDEVGALGCFLCSDDASYITGETVVVAGGVQSRL